MSRADYAHWNEEQDIVWWAEEGRHAEYNPDPDWDDSPSLWDERDVEEHYGEDDCLRDSCFSLPSKTGIWECDVCGQQYPDGHPEEPAALQGRFQAHYPDGCTQSPDA